MLDHGRIVAEGTPAQLKRLVPGGAVRIEFTERAGASSRAAHPHRLTRDASPTA